MSTKVFTLLAVVVFFASIVSSQAFNPDRHRAGPPLQDIESFQVVLVPGQEDTLLVLGTGQNYVLTDVSIRNGSASLRVESEVRRNSSTHLAIESETGVWIHQVSFASGVAFHAGDTFAIRNNGGANLLITAMGYFYLN